MGGHQRPSAVDLQPTTGGDLKFKGQVPVTSPWVTQKRGRLGGVDDCSENCVGCGCQKRCSSKDPQHMMMRAFHSWTAYPISCTFLHVLNIVHAVGRINLGEFTLKPDGLTTGSGDSSYGNHHKISIFSHCWSLLHPESHQHVAGFALTSPPFQAHLAHRKRWAAVFLQMQLFLGPAAPPLTASTPETATQFWWRVWQQIWMREKTDSKCHVKKNCWVDA